MDPAAALARDIAAADAREFRNQYSAFSADSAGETRRDLDALGTDTAYRSRYRDFIVAMAYGERLEFNTAVGTVVALAEQTIQYEENGPR